MTTIDERVAALMSQLPYANKTEGGVVGFRAALQNALLQVARDQRHTCAEALLAIDRNAWSLDAAHNAVMNAPPPATTKE